MASDERSNAMGNGQMGRLDVGILCKANSNEAGSHCYPIFIGQL